MKPALRRLFAMVCLVAGGTAWAADVGRVLLAAGDTVAVRDKQIVKLVFGSTVQDKDLLRTGAASSLQVRFIDESILSVRENSEMRIDEFRYTGKEDGTERAFFSLLKGGLRKITGIIGRTNNKNYQMGSVVGTIGIRGTDYASSLCQQNCRNPDGTLAKDGQYTRVIGASSGTNRLTYANQTPVLSFGIGENFYVADVKSPPQPLLEPPGFLNVPVKGRSAKPPAGTGTEVAAAGGAEQDPRGATPPPPAVVLPRILAGEASTTGSFPDPATSATTGTGVTVVAPLPAATGYVVAYPLPPFAPLGDVVFDDDRIPLGIFNLQNQLIAYGTLGTFPAGALNGGSITDTGSLTLSNGQVITWGRWMGNTRITLDDGSTFTGAPVLFGTATGLTSGSVIGSLGGMATYTYAGGPRPVDAGGNVGNITSNIATINFTAQTAFLSLGINFPSIVASGVNTGPANFGVSGTGFRILNGHTGELSGPLSGTCTGSGCFGGSGPAFGFFDVGLTGANGFEFAVFAGVITETQAGDVAFLNGYLASSFTSGPAPVAGTTTPVSALTFSSSAPGKDNGDLAEVSNSPTGQLQLDTTGTKLEAASGLNHPFFGNVSINRNGAAFADLGSDSTEGTVSWGRWGPGAVEMTSLNGTQVPPTGIHWFFGPATAHGVIAAKTGMVNYLPAGGTNPTHSSGAVGTFTGGAFNVNFTTQTLGGSLHYSVASNAYMLSVPYTTPIVNSNGAATFGIAPNSVGGFCSPSCSAPGAYSVGGVFTGATGKGLGVTYATDHPSAGQTAGAQFFKQ